MACVRFKFVAIATLMLVAFPACERKASQTSSAIGDVCLADQEDFSVFSAVLKHMESIWQVPGDSKTKNWVVLSRTNGAAIGEKGQWDFDRKNWKLSAKDTPPPSEVVKIKFRGNVNRRCAMLGDLSSAMPATWISEKDEKAIFQPTKDPWDTFYRRFPNSTGISSFSYPGYNRQRTEALVGFSVMCGGLCGEGDLFLLRKEDGTWKVVGSSMLWVS